MFSYVRSSAMCVQDAVKDTVPIEFQLRRARDLLNDIIPEMQANIRTIAQQEVEISNLKGEIVQNNRTLAEEGTRVQKLRNCLATTQTSYTIGGISYSRDHLKDELARRFDRYKEAEVVLAGKQRLLENRERSLGAGMQVLERTRSQKAMLENQIETLDGQFRLVQAASVGSKLQIDNSKIAQTEKLIAQIKKQLDVAERVLAHEARFTDAIQIDVVNEKDLVAAVDEHFSAPQKTETAKAEKDQSVSQSEN
jgi:hypothetical protein